MCYLNNFVKKIVELASKSLWLNGNASGGRIQSFYKVRFLSLSLFTSSASASPRKMSANIASFPVSGTML